MRSATSRNARARPVRNTSMSVATRTLNAIPDSKSTSGLPSSTPPLAAGPYVVTVHPLCRSIVTLSAFFGTSPLENSASEPFS